MGLVALKATSPSTSVVRLSRRLVAPGGSLSSLVGLVSPYRWSMCMAMSSCLPAQAKLGAWARLHMPKAHRVVCATSARSCAITSGAALPVSCIRRQHSSLHRASAPALKPARPSPSRTSIIWPRNSSRACAHWGLPMLSAVGVAGVVLWVMSMARKGLC